MSRIGPSRNNISYRPTRPLESGSAAGVAPGPAIELVARHLVGRKSEEPHLVRRDGCFARQAEQIRRARRCATAETTVEQIRNASMFMSMRRTRLPMESSVWNVANTLWPVSAASMAIDAVSRSRISPTTMTSGSWRTTSRSVVGKSRPAAASIEHWMTPSTTYSTGILDGDDLDARFVAVVNRTVERRGLARPGGPREQHNACRDVEDGLLVLLQQRRQHAEFFDRQQPVGLVAEYG